MRTFAVSSNSLNHIMTCPAKAHMITELRQVPRKKDAALERGGLLHKMFAPYYYSRIKDVKDHHLYLEVTDENGAVQKVKNPLARFIGMPHIAAVTEAIHLGRLEAAEGNLPVKETEEVIHQFSENVNFYEHDGWEALEVEVPFSKVLFKREDEWNEDHTVIVKEGIEIIWGGIIDLVAFTPKWGLTIVDHKSSSRRKRVSPMSAQFIGYCWAMGIPDMVVNKVGFQKSLKPEERFERHPLHYQRHNFEDWGRSAIWHVEKYVGCVDAGYFPYDYTGCSQWSGCVFQREDMGQVCFAPPELREFKLRTFFNTAAPRSHHDFEEMEDDDF